MKQAQEDKHFWLQAHINDNDWNWVKRLRRGFNTRSTRLKNKAGKVVPNTQKTQVSEEKLKLPEAPKEKKTPQGQYNQIYGR